MIIIPYQTKIKLKRIGIGILIALLVLAIITACWLVWLQRFIVYTREGVYFDFDHSTTDIQAAPAAPTQVAAETVSIRFEDEAAPTEPTQTSSALRGVYVSTEQLLNGLPQVEAALDSLEAGQAVMLDVKSIYGNFYYSSHVSADYSESIDQAAMDQLIAKLAKKNVYLIARLPAFRDSAYALSNHSDSLTVEEGYLWVDESKCYWIDPGSENGLAHLVQICQELKSLGFDEVVFYDFRFPDSSQIAYDAETDRAALIASVAQRLCSACATDSFRVSFTWEDDTFVPPDGVRLYHSDISAAELPELLETLSQFGDSISQRLVFLTDTRDTRFEEFGLLRALDLEQ